MAKGARTREAGWPPALRRVLLAAFWIYLALSLYVLWRAAVLTPYSDELDWIGRWYAFRGHHDWRAYLLEPVNFHRIPLTFALIDLDIRRLGGTNLPLIASGAIGLGIMAWALAGAAARAATGALKLPAALAAAMLTLMAGSVLDAATPICVDYVHGAALAVLALLLAEGADRRHLAWRGPLALVCAMAAGLGDGAALAVWPVLALGAARRRRWIWLAAVLVAGVAYLAFYLHGQASGMGGGSLQALRHPLSALRLVLGYLLLPWTRLVPYYAWIGGLVVAVIAVAAVWRRGGQGAGPAERTAAALILFTLVTALMAGLGRTGLSDPANVALRYAVLVTPLHVGLLMLALPWAGELWRANRLAAQALVTALIVGLLAQDAVMALKAIRASDANRHLIAGFKAGRRGPEMALVHPDAARAQAVYARLRRDGLFQRELHLKGAAAAR
jgi:hypothetical protein